MLHKLLQKLKISLCLHMELRDVNDLESKDISIVVVVAIRCITLCIKFKVQCSPQFVGIYITTIVHGTSQ